LACFFFPYTPSSTTDSSPLSLHDALPILSRTCQGSAHPLVTSPAGRHVRPRKGTFPTPGRLPPAFTETSHIGERWRQATGGRERDRKSTRLNSSHVSISYAVFCLKKKKND